ncbi:MAG: hypothetical protein K8J09_19750 [Planctomycetes bacterium]|nr:hypothetical protein [Planctomycetota bacterium]
MERVHCIHRLAVPLQFPAGLAPGSGKGLSNELVLSRDGSGRPVLRGSALAGCLRHAYARVRGLAVDPLRPGPEIRRYFGEAIGSDRGHESPLRVADCLLEIGASMIAQRNHNAIDRHQGGPRDKSLFRLQALPPGTRTTAILVLDSDEPEAKEFLAQLVGLFAAGLTVGGSVARGIGIAEIAGEPRYRRFALHLPQDRADWLDESWAWRDPKGHRAPWSGEVLRPAAVARDLVLELRLAVPRGQDLCVADGRGVEHEAEPQCVQHADGHLRWRIPGSSLRGVMRSWITRLAAREGALVRDSLARFHKDGPAKGDEFGWGFRGKEERDRIQQHLRDDPGSLAMVLDCPVERLFGTLFHASRIQFTDALSVEVADREKHAQVRMHVGIDRISGGANDGLLFDHLALLPGVEFRCKITVRNAEQHEVQWLVQTFRAMDLGLLHFGSSKSTGRLKLVAPVLARGPHAELFETLQKKEDTR